MAKNGKKAQENSSMMFVISFFTVFVINAVIIFLGNLVFPNQLVLGTHSLTPFWAMVLPSATLSLITVLLMPFLTRIEISRAKEFSPLEYIMIYLVVNFVSLWLMTRQSEVFGMGVRSWVVVFVLAVVLDFVQGGVMTVIQNMKKKA